MTVVNPDSGSTIKSNHILLQIRLKRNYLLSDKHKNTKPENTFGAIGYFNEISYCEKGKFQELFKDNQMPEVGTEIQYLYLGGEIRKKGKRGSTTRIFKNDSSLPLIAISGIKICGSGRQDKSYTCRHDVAAEAILSEIDSILPTKGKAALFFGLGFCDYFIVWRAEKYKDIIKSLIELRYALLKKEEYKEKFNLDFTYSIPGYQYDYSSDEVEANYKLSLFSLNPSMNWCMNEGNLLGDIFAVFGTHDFIQLSGGARINKCRLDHFLGFELSDHEREKVKEMLDEESEPSNLAVDIRRNIDKIIRSNKEDGYLSDTQVSKLRNLALFFNSVVYSRSIDHFLIQEWHSIFNRFSQLVLISLERWKNSSEDERKGIKCDYVISFEVGMDYISDFVRAWTKGSRSTIEGPIRSIYHTGGITKIAYFYSLISKKIEEQLNRVAELRGFPFSKENGESNYQFFVVPSWTSVLESHYIFKELPPDYGRLMPIKIPIEDYFNFHRIGLLFHELGHYYPSQRVDRNSYFFSQVIRAMSMSFAEEYLQELIRREDEDDWNHANNAKCQTIVEIIKEVRKWTENQVVEIIRNHVEKDIQENINKQISKFGDYLKVRLRKFIIADEENFLDKKISIVQEELNKAFLRHRAELRENMLNDTGPEESKGKDKLLMYELSIFLSRKGFRPDQIDTADKGKDEETGNDKVQEKDNQGKGQNNGYSLGNGCWSTDYYQLLGEEIATWRELLKEVKADYFMCKTLRFTREQYHKTLDKKDTLTLNCDMYKESARHDQIERRKSIVELTGIFEKREGRIENDWRTDMADIIKTGIADKEMSEFLDTPTIKACQDFCNENNSDKNSLVLLYSVLCQG